MSAFKGKFAKLISRDLEIAAQTWKSVGLFIFQ